MRTANKMIVVLESPLESSTSLDPPSVVKVREVTLMPLILPELTRFSMLFWAVTAPFEPAASFEVIAISTTTEPDLMEKMMILLIATPAASAIWFKKPR